MRVRRYQPEDVLKLVHWWENVDNGKKVSSFPYHTYVVENDVGDPWVALSLILTDFKGFALLENLIANPDIAPFGRRDAVEELVNHISGVAKQLGYESLLCLAINGALQARYQDLGFTPQVENLTMMTKRI